MFSTTLQKSFNTAFETPPGSKDTVLRAEDAVRHFLFALERYLRQIGVSKANEVMGEIRKHELKYIRPQNDCKLFELTVSIHSSGIMAWYGKAANNNLSFAGDIDLKCFYRFAKSILPAEYFYVSHVTWARGDAPMACVLLEGA